MTRAGYATFAIDRLGAGRSSHPTSTAFRPDTIVGQYDDLICGDATGSNCSSSAAFLAQERPWYGPEAELEAVIVKDMATH